LGKLGTKTFMIWFAPPPPPPQISMFEEELTIGPISLIHVLVQITLSNKVVMSI